MTKLGRLADGIRYITSFHNSIASLFEIGFSRLGEEINATQIKLCGLFFDSPDKGIANAKTAVVGRHSEASEKTVWRVQFETDDANDPVLVPHYPELVQMAGRSSMGSFSAVSKASIEGLSLLVAATTAVVVGIRLN